MLQWKINLSSMTLVIVYFEAGASTFYIFYAMIPYISVLYYNHVLLSKIIVTSRMYP